ncbi:MAG: YdcF family protein [Planctomycetota bacterium]
MQKNVLTNRPWPVRLLSWLYQILAVVSMAFLLVVVLLKFSPVGMMMAEPMMRSTPLAELPQADAIVVLGGDAFRLADAMRVYRAGKAPLIVVCGASEAAADFLEIGQVPSRDVRWDWAPKRTADHPRTIQAVAEIDESSKIILVSSLLHQRRALQVFRDAGYARVWVCSWEWEEHLAAKEDRWLGHDKVACLLYEFGARVKSWVVD